MSQRLDDLFSVERLRRSWSERQAGSSAEARQEAHPPEELALEAREVLQRLKAMISRRFSAQRRIPLDALLQSLDTLVDAIHPLEPDSSRGPEQLQELVLSASRLCDDLEDMIEAMELAEPEDRSGATRGAKAP